MDASVGLIILGLLFLVAASLILLIPTLFVKRNVDDNFILNMDKKGNYAQRKDIKDRRLAKISISLFIVGLIFQIVGIILN